MTQSNDSMTPHKQRNRQTKKKQQEQTLQQANVNLYNFNSRKWKKFDEVCCCV